MVEHIVLWNIKEEIIGEERKRVKKNIKKELEALNGKIDGLLKIKVVIEPLPSANAEVMLYSTFVDGQALADYLVHPEHKRVGKDFVRPFVCNRMCMDYSE